MNIDTFIEHQNITHYLDLLKSESDPANLYEAVTCTACTRIHLVNPRTGRVLGADGD
jgi:hypothetical protein